MPPKHVNIDELLGLAYESDSPKEIKKLTKKILEQDPNHPEALFLLADTLEDEEEQLTLLSRAYKIAKKNFYAEFNENKDNEDFDALDSENGLVYVGIIQRMIIPLSDSGKIDEAFNLAQDLRKLDPENQTQSHAIYYYMLLKKKDFSRVLEETMKDSVRSLAWAWSRFIAVFMLSGECSSSRKYFWEAIQMSPDVPFYMTGKYEDPAEDTEDEQEDFSLALLYTEHITCNSENLTAYVMSRGDLFGLLSNRITDEDPDEYDAAIEILKISGLMDNYVQLLDKLEGKDYDDQYVIQMISGTLSC